jgi:sigma-E factor negative regulatory protein RseB
MSATWAPRTPLLTAAVAVVAGLVVALPGGQATAGTDPEALLRRARAASATTPVAGIVEVRWRDGDGDLQTDRTGARARDGAYVVGRGGSIAVGVGGLRWAAGDGVATRWGHVGDTDPPAPGSAWELAVDGSAEVAGRRANVVVARRGDGPVRARFFVDRASGLLVRRDVLQRDGDVVRSVRFTRLTTDDISPAVPPVPQRGPKVTTTDEVGGEYLAPDRLESGFHLLGRYEQPGGAVQLFYSDGLFSLSLFEQPGEVEWEALPEGGRRDTVAEQRAQWYATHAGTVVVWSRDGLVLTGVSDAPPDTVRAAVATVKAPEGGVVDDVVDFVLEPFDWE